MFLDGIPPLWRFQLQCIEAFAAWYKSYAHLTPQAAPVMLPGRVGSCLVQVVGQVDRDRFRILAPEIRLSRATRVRSGSRSSSRFF